MILFDNYASAGVLGAVSIIILIIFGLVLTWWKKHSGFANPFIWTFISGAVTAIVSILMIVGFQANSEFTNNIVLWTIFAVAWIFVNIVFYRYFHRVSEE
ncbi:MAG: hypothetical protein AAGF95_22015 [Chloroflexota bacterium]